MAINTGIDAEDTLRRHTVRGPDSALLEHHRLFLLLVLRRCGRCLWRGPASAGSFFTRLRHLSRMYALVEHGAGSMSAEALERAPRRPSSRRFREPLAFLSGRCFVMLLRTKSSTRWYPFRSSFFFGIAFERSNAAASPTAFHTDALVGTTRDAALTAGASLRSAASCPSAVDDGPSRDGDGLGKLLFGGRDDVLRGVRSQRRDAPQTRCTPSPRELALQKCDGLRLPPEERRGPYSEAFAPVTARRRPGR